MGITVLPMPFMIDGETYYEDITLTQEQFYQRLKDNSDISTSQPTPDSIMKLWDELLKEYLPEELLRARIGCDEGNAVARLQPERAGRNMNLLLPAFDRADQDLCLCDAGQFHQRPARQRRIRRQLEFQKFDLAAEECVSLDRRRRAQRARHFRRTDQLRIDGQAQAQIV